LRSFEDCISISLELEIISEKAALFGWDKPSAGNNSPRTENGLLDGFDNIDSVFPKAKLLSSVKNSIDMFERPELVFQICLDL
jgi:hypothetical protein